MSDDAIYQGRRGINGRIEVTVDGEPLPPRLDLRNHSPLGFEWGYAGSGPAQLSLAILAREVGDELAMSHYMEFKRRRVEHFGFLYWELRGVEVRRFVERSPGEAKDLPF